MNRKNSICSMRGADRGTGPNGFTLMELLIVIAIILILMLMAIPTIGSLKKSANETSAKQSMRAIAQAEMQYDPSAGPPSATAAQILQNDLASGVKSGYLFSVGSCTKVTLNGTDRYTGYQVTAVPQTVGKTGDRGYCSDQFGTIKQDPAGGTNCTQPIQ